MSKRNQEQDYYYEDEYDDYQEYYPQPKQSIWKDVIKSSLIIVAVILGLSFLTSVVQYIVNNDTPSKGFINETPSKSGTHQQAIKPSTTTPTTTAKAEIVDIDVAMATNSIGTTYMQVAVVIENTGNTNLFLSDASFDIETPAGDLVTSQSYVNGYPQVIAPGERGVFFDSFSNDNFDTTKQYRVVPHLSVKKATVDLIRFEYSDIKIQEGSYGIYIDVLGRVHNNTTEDESMTMVVIICYDKDGNVIDVIYSYKNYAAGEKKGFEISHHPDIDISIDDISSYDVYVYPYQYQFN